MSKSKYILALSQLDIINETYSIRGKEFFVDEKLSNNRQTVLRHKKIKWYLITIQQSDTSQVYVVTHSDHTGKITYVDRWILKDKQLEWLYRDIPSESRSQMETIEYLNQCIEDSNKVLKECEEDKELFRRVGREYRDKYLDLQKRTQEMEEIIAELKRNGAKSDKKSNAGRKLKIDDELFNKIEQEIEQGTSKIAIAKKYGISRATVYNTVNRMKEK